MTRHSPPFLPPTPRRLAAALRRSARPFRRRCGMYPASFAQGAAATSGSSRPPAQVLRGRRLLGAVDGGGGGGNLRCLGDPRPLALLPGSRERRRVSSCAPTSPRPPHDRFFSSLPFLPTELAGRTIATAERRGAAASRLCPAHPSYFLNSLRRKLKRRRRGASFSGQPGAPV